MKKTRQVDVADEDIIALVHILMDDDAEAAMKFQEIYFKGKARELLEGG